MTLNNQLEKIDAIFKKKMAKKQLDNYYKNKEKWLARAKKYREAKKQATDPFYNEKQSLKAIAYYNFMRNKTPNFWDTLLEKKLKENN
jgi:hypothetical protein